MTTRTIAPDAHKPESQDKPITIGGKNLNLRFSLRAMIALKDHWKLSDDEDMQAKGATTGDQKVIDRLSNPTMEDFVVIVWAACRSHHPEMTLDDVLSLIDDGGIAGLRETLDSVIKAGAPPPQKKKAADKKTTKSRR